MDSKTRQEMRKLAEGFSMQSHQTGMVVRPLVHLLTYSIDNLKQAGEYARQVLAELAKVEANVPLKEVRAVQAALKEIDKATASGMQRLEGAKTPLRRIIAGIDGDLQK